MPYMNPNLAMLGAWLLPWAIAWDTAVYFWGPKR